MSKSSFLKRLSLASMLFVNAAIFSHTVDLKYNEDLRLFKLDKINESGEAIYQIHDAGEDNSITMWVPKDGGKYLQTSFTNEATLKSIANGLQYTMSIKESDSDKEAIITITHANPNWVISRPLTTSIKAKFKKGDFEDLIQGEKVELQVLEKEKLETMLNEILRRMSINQYTEKKLIEDPENARLQVLINAKDKHLRSITIEDGILSTNFLKNASIKVFVWKK